MSHEIAQNGCVCVCADFACLSIAMFRHRQSRESFRKVEYEYVVCICDDLTYASHRKGRHPILEAQRITAVGHVPSRFSAPHNCARSTCLNLHSAACADPAL